MATDAGAEGVARAGALPPLEPIPENALPMVPSREELPLPTVEETALPVPSIDATKERKVRLNKMELPSGYELDPEEWGIDLTYAPATARSNFATEMEEDEPASLVELPAELRQFMNSEEGQKLSPEEVKSMLAEVLKEHLPQTTPVPVPEPVVESKRSLLKRAIPLAWVLFFLFNWQLALIFLVPIVMIWWGVAALKLQKDASSTFEQDVKRWQRTGKVRLRR